jgi:hypothetical protein
MMDALDTPAMLKTLLGPRVWTKEEYLPRCRHDGYFVDLFVRKSNDVAIHMYRRMGYSVYREVLGYYSNIENALGASRLPPALSQTVFGHGVEHSIASAPAGNKSNCSAL